MKKFVLITVGAAMAFGAYAEDYTVYNNGALGAGTAVYNWYNGEFDFNAANPTGGDAKVFSFKAGAANLADASMGINYDANPGQFNTATLNFSWYAVGTGTYTIRLTSVAEENY